VVGIPDARWGEVVCAVVVAAPGREDEIDVDALRAHCDGRLAAFKQPRRVELVAALPRTAATRQIQRTLLVEQIASAG
jgi:acyl-CoA synthetase (AMP-forming)/AMP-acid ligase II